MVNGVMSYSCNELYVIFSKIERDGFEGVKWDGFNRK